MVGDVKMVKILYAGQPHSDIKGKTYNGQVFSSIELELLDQERRQYYTPEYSSLVFIESIKNQHIAVETQKFIEDLKKVAKELSTNDELFKKNLIQDIKMSLGKKLMMK